MLSAQMHHNVGRCSKHTESTGRQRYSNTTIYVPPNTDWEDSIRHSLRELFGNGEDEESVMYDLSRDLVKVGDEQPYHRTGSWLSGCTSLWTLSTLRIPYRAYGYAYAWQFPSRKELSKDRDGSGPREQIRHHIEDCSLDRYESRGALAPAARHASRMRTTPSGMRPSVACCRTLKQTIDQLRARPEGTCRIRRETEERERPDGLHDSQPSNI